MSDLKPPLTGYSLWFMAQESDHRTLQNLIEYLADHAGTRPFDAHATLIGLLEMTDEQAVLQGAQLLASTADPFEVEIIGSGSRDKHFQSLFLTCVPSPPALGLNSAARTHFHHENDPPFMLHWSAVYGDLQLTMKRARKNDIEQRLSFPLMVKVTEIAAINCTGFPDEWKIIQRFPLKKG